MEAIWGQTSDEAESAAKDLNIPFATSRVDEVLLRKDVDLVVILCPPSHHSQISVKALGTMSDPKVACMDYLLSIHNCFDLFAQASGSTLWCNVQLG